MAPQSGVQRYVRELDARFGGELRRISPRIGLNGAFGHAWEQLVVPLLSRGRVLFSPGNTGPLLFSNQVVTIHDASTFDYPDAFTGLFGRWYRWLLPRLARRCLGVITVSEFSRRRLVATLGIDAARIAVVYNGVTAPPSVVNAEIVQNIREQLKLPARFLLFVGSQDPRKNVSQLLKAFSLVNLDGLELVLAGGNNAQLFANKEPTEAMTGVRSLGHVSEEILEALYVLADAFVFPSHYEGFGLPPLEAMARGCPVLCSDSSCLPEICGPSFDHGGAPIYFSPNDVSQLSSAIRRFSCMSEVERRLMTDAGRRWAARFTWDRCAEQTALALNGFAARRGTSRLLKNSTPA